MMNAIAYDHKEVVKVLFDFGYTVDTVIKQGKMLLEWAIEHGHLSLIEVHNYHYLCIGVRNSLKLKVFYFILAFVFYVNSPGHD